MLFVFCTSGSNWDILLGVMLSIVATPIGNLQDISLRQAETIMGADVILTEDTRTTGILKQQLVGLFDLEANPAQRLVSYYRDREFDKLPEAIAHIEDEKEVVLISESGMPLVSDPGYLLIQTVIKRDIPFQVIPGPTAATTAVIYSGFDPTRFGFFGFLPKKEKEIEKEFTRVRAAGLESCYVWYESAKRLPDTMAVLAAVDPDAKVCICREMTKRYEEIIRGTPAELTSREYKGEITLVVQFSKHT